MKTILVLYTKDDWDKDLPSIKPRFLSAYEAWAKYCKINDMRLVRAEINWFDGNEFTKYWTYEGSWQKVDESISPDIVYDKTTLYRENQTFNFDDHSLKTKIAEKFPVVNSPEFSQLINSKLNQSVIFKEFMPETTFYTKERTLENPDGKKMVLKHIYGSGGMNITITSEPKIRIENGTIVQEFIKSAGGVIRDYRIVFIGNDVAYSASRFAKEGSEFTNTHQGAVSRLIDMNEIPEIIDHAKKVARKLDIFSKKIFSLDFLLADGNKPYLIEANTMPGFGIITEDAIVMERYFSKLTEYLFT